MKDLKLIEKISTQYNIGHLVAADGFADLKRKTLELIKAARTSDPLAGGEDVHHPAAVDRGFARYKNQKTYVAVVLDVDL